MAVENVFILQWVFCLSMVKMVEILILAHQ